MAGNRPWAAELTMDCDRAAALIRDQFPQYAPKELTLLGTGWDNSAFLADGRMVWRFPVRALGASLIETEIAALGTIAKAVSLPVPNPVCAGEPARDYPYRFVGYRYIAGATACSAAWAEIGMLRIAPDLGRFLKALHGIPVDTELHSVLPGDLLRRTDLPLRCAQLEERLTAANALLTEQGLNPDAIARQARRLAETPASQRPVCVVHGDLYLRHLLVAGEAAESLRLTGVIDWGDVHIGDRSLDLSIAYSMLCGEARRLFFETYGPCEECEHARARFNALYYGVILLIYGQDVGDPDLMRAGEHALHCGMMD